MRKPVKAFMILLTIFISLPSAVEAASATKINDLIEKAKTYDGQELLIEGEAIGEEMNRGDNAWININDGSNAIGVWLRKEDAGKVKIFGNYKNIGDTIRITGVFYRACKEHGGEADFHSTSVEIIKSGHRVAVPVSILKMIAAAVLSGAVLILILVFQKLRARRN